MEELRGFLAERAKATGKRDEYLELQFAQAMDGLTLAGYQAFRQEFAKVVPGWSRI